MYNQIITNLKAEEANSGTDLADVMAIIQRNYDKGILVELHSFDSNSVKEFAIFLIYIVPNDTVSIVKKIYSNGTIEDWAVNNPIAN